MSNELSYFCSNAQLHSSLTTFRYGFRTAHNTLRKKKKISQGEPEKMMKTSGDIIGRYERDEVKPSIEVVIRMAYALEVSLDYFVSKTDMELDSYTLSRIREAAKLPEKDMKQVFLVIDVEKPRVIDPVPPV